LRNCLSETNLLARANRDIEVLRWLVRMATDRKLLTPRQYEHCCLSLAECGRMVGGWCKQASSRKCMNKDTEMASNCCDVVPPGSRSWLGN